MSSPAPNSSTVVVTADEAFRVFTGREAIGNIQEVAATDDTVSDVEKAAVLAGLGNTLDKLRRAEKAAGAKVLSTPNDGRAARLQSLIASGEAAKLLLHPLTSGGLEAIFDTDDWSGWATVAWAKLTNPIKHRQPVPGTLIPDPLAERARVALLGDWGTGMYGAPHIADAVRKDGDGFELLLHLGDVYYSGTVDEINGRFLALWPTRQGATSRALNSNHEMFSGGKPYFTRTLDAFGQKSSYFAFQNANWTLIGLDVAYIDHDIDDEQAWWVSEVVRNAGSRKVVLFSHHQLYSNIEKAQGDRLWSHATFGALLRSRRVFAWYWGHEHRCTIFEEPDREFGIYGRCIGHGGMPQARDLTKGLPRSAHSRYAAADWRVCDEMAVGPTVLSRAVVLEGPNPFITGEEEKFTPHGYSVLEFDGPHLREDVRDANGAVIYSRQLC
ncbi:metallophosphoesterase family protein [Bradyrhizobium sp. HKCCYLS20291]|uniref:metallophosphoesterase family protein n=1 Tax=Bradyrhizobium sp. HKCCYLS20291 TaxID=3420766 RepID=UPI003EBB4B08